jgi:hypothetical protein
MKPLRLGRVEIVAENFVHEVGLRVPEPVGSSPYERFVIVGNNELLVLCGEGPSAYVAVQLTALARIGLDVVALLAERLEVAEFIRALADTGDFVVRAESNIRLLPPAGSALKAVLLFEPHPVSLGEFFSRLALLTHFQTLQLVAVAFLSDTGEAFLPLQLSHAPEHVFVWGFPVFGTKTVYSGADLVFRQHWPRHTVADWPKCFQNYRVIELVGWAGGDEGRCGVRKPAFPTGLRFVRRGPGRYHKPGASSGSRHRSVGL